MDAIPSDMMLKEVKYTGKFLGKGAFGAVEEVKISGAICACKTLHNILIHHENQLSGDSQISKKFKIECQLMSTIRHPNIVQFFGFCKHPRSEIPALVMEQLACSLDDLLTRAENEEQTIPLSLKMSILTDTLRGLAYLHSHDPCVVHRDLTARNVLLTSSMDAKIADFGNALVIDEETLYKKLSTLPGASVYMPPEAYPGSSYSLEQSTKVDIFSFGHLALYTIIQEFPMNLLPQTYYRSVPRKHLEARSEIDRRELYIEKLYQEVGKDHLISKIVQACLDNSPEERPKAKDMLSTIILSAPEGEILMSHDYTNIYHSKFGSSQLIQQIKSVQVYDGSKAAKKSISTQRSISGSISSTSSTFAQSGDADKWKMGSFKNDMSGQLELVKVSKSNKKSTRQKPKKYTFEIVEDTLSYYDKPKPKGEIKLVDIERVSVPQSLPDYRFEVVCKGSGKDLTTYQLSAQSEEERTDWLQAIRSRIPTTYTEEYDDVLNFGSSCKDDYRFNLATGESKQQKRASVPTYEDMSPNIAYNVDIQMIRSRHVSKSVKQFANRPTHRAEVTNPFTKSQSSLTLLKPHDYEMVDEPTNVSIKTGRQADRQRKFATSKLEVMRHGFVTTDRFDNQRQSWHENPSGSASNLPRLGHQRSSSLEYELPTPMRLAHDDNVTQYKGYCTSADQIPVENSKIAQRRAMLEAAAGYKQKSFSTQRLVPGTRKVSQGEQACHHQLQVQLSSEVKNTKAGRHQHHGSLVTSPKPGQFTDGHDPLSLLQEQASNVYLHRSQLSDLEEIGSGYFGRVYKANFRKDTQLSSIRDHDQTGYSFIKVAVKEIKEYKSVQERENFIKEMNVMKEMTHPNIIQLYGIVQEDPPRLVLEFLPKGNLKDYLTKNKSPVEKLCKYMLDVSMGMEYLQGKGLVHRDLAARNIMVKEDETCKVADFGLLREIPQDDTVYQATQEFPWPFRWMAPESLNKKEFSSASDVWSFGVLCWEMYYPTEMPYAQFGALEYGGKIAEGYRLTIPTEYPSTVQTFMKCCWYLSPEDRPKFTLISSVLKKIRIHGDSIEVEECAEYM